MKSISENLSGLAIIGWLIASLNLGHAQTITRIVPSAPASDTNIMSVLAQARALVAEEPVLEQSIPVTATEPSAELPAGTYWSLQNTMPPLPYDLFPELPVYVVDPTNGVFLVDDRSVDFPALQAQQRTQAQVETMAGSMMAMGAPMPGDGGDNGTNSYAFNGSGYAVDYGTNLWLSVTNFGNNRVSGLIHNSSSLVPYALLSRPSLIWPVWSPAATFYGSVITTNVTPFSLPALARGSLFIRARAQYAPGIIGAGSSHNVAIRRDGTVWAWGANGYGQLGNGQWTASSLPAQVTGLSNVVAVVAPPDDACTLALDSNGKVWSWGANSSGQLGRSDGLYANANSAALVPGLSNIVAIAGGYGDAVALKSDGTVWMWGDNEVGELGDGTYNTRDYAAPVPGLTNAVAIAAGAYHNFALCADGRVRGWGYNGDGELGLGNTTDQLQPVVVGALTNVVALSGGLFHSVALLADGTVKAWGDNSNGQIGNTGSSTPLTVSGLSNILAIACGGYHNLVLDTNGALYLWGNGSGYQLGNGSANNVAIPFSLTSVSNVTAIAGGESSSMISTADGSIYEWGSSGFGQQSVPYRVDLYANYSSDGSGLPDWWELRYFGHWGVDPAADPDGDGWSNLQEYQRGNNPTNFDTPPTPSGLVITQSVGQSGITLTWSAATPAPVNYLILRSDFSSDTLNYGNFQQIGEVTGNVTTFVDNGSMGGDANSIYAVQALYAGGPSPLSSQAYVNSTAPAAFNYNLPIAAHLVRNTTGRWQLMFSGIPINAQTIRLFWYSNGVENATEDITSNNIANGVYPISDAEVVNYLGNTLYVEGLSTNLLPGQLFYVGVLSDDAPYFVDGRRHLKQNLSFLIRAASLYHPFGVFVDDRLDQLATNFEESSFLLHNGPFNLESASATAQLDDLWPFRANYDFANYFVDVSQTNTIQYFGGYFPPYGTNEFIFQPNFATNVPTPAILAQADPYWIQQPNFSTYYPGNPYGFYVDTTNWGVTVSSDLLTASLQSGLYNLFGLPELTGCAIDVLLESETFTWIYQPLAPGGNVTVEQTNNCYIEFYASWCPAPTLNFINYYFAPVINPAGDEFDLPGNAYLYGQTMIQPYPLPILDDFNVTNQTPAAMFGSVGQPMILGSWAKYSIQGSNPTKYAYLGQYFTTNAFKVNSSGNLTTTNTGIVSPYGEFFPTEPGPVALITMPDIDTGMQATGIVQVISLALDANHDGAIDTKFNGPDAVSANHPYRFWRDNNYDRGHTIDGSDFEQDDVSSTDDAAKSPYTGVSTPDFDYRAYPSGNRVIPCTRDLEDFARLWVCGLTSNLVASLPSGSTVTLSWGDVGNPNPNNPTIDLFTAADADGGAGYLTNETTATIQIDPTQSPYIGRLGPGQSIQLNYNYFGNTWRGNHFIWCGVSNGTGGLTLTITDAHSNVLAKTSTYIQLVDIKQMYERWTVGENPGIAPASTAQIATNDLPSGVLWPFQYANPGNSTTPYILFVHGWNMETWEKDRYAEAAFKRLYWQGYKGRFGSFRWPTGNGFSGIISVLTDARNYDNSEFNAWPSASGLLNKLAGLNNQYPGHVYLMAHSMGNVVAGEALRLAGTNQLVNTYVAMQGAVPAHGYDASTANRTTYLPPDCYAHYWTNGASCYFNGSAGAGTYVNFYNTNDWALGYWNVDQNWKPDGGLASPGYYYATPSGLHPSGFYKIYGSTDYELSFPTDTHEIFAYADPAWSFALGAQASVGGSFQLLGVPQQVNLPSVWPIDTHPQIDNKSYSAHVWHSAEFRSDNMSRAIFWNTVLKRMNISP